MKSAIFRIVRASACAACLVCLAAVVPLAAQSSSGPITLPSAPDVVRLPNRPAPDAPPMPTEEIVRRFAQQEDAASLALGEFTYRKTIRLEELGPDGRPTGRAEVITQMTVESDGSRRPRPAGRPESTLRFVGLEPDVLEVLGHMPVFPFATSQLAKYDIVYQTTEPVDDLTTYVLKVTPKRLDRATAYFSGVIWVDDRDFAVVRSYGKWVTETGEVTLSELPFTLYETYRAYVGNKYWMPAYIRSDGFIGGTEPRIPVRLTIRWESYTPVLRATPVAPPVPAMPDPPPSLNR